jgi:sugar phosphate permease
MQLDISNNPHLKKARISTITLTIICQSFQALTLGGIALMLPLIRQDLGLTFTQGGTIAALSTFVYALMQIPSGYLSDRFSPKNLFFIGVLGTTILSLTFGLVQNYWEALINQAFSGFFRALLFAPGMALLTGWFSQSHRATAMGLFLVGGASGSVLFNLIGPLLVAKFDWRFAFIAIASLGVLTSLVFLKLGQEAPIKQERKNVGLLEPLKLFRYKLMWNCGILQFIRYSTTQGITYWLPSLLINEKELPLQITGIIIAMQAILIAPSNLIGGYVSDRLKNPIPVIAVALVVLVITTSLIVVINNIPLLITIVAINAIFIQSYFGPLFSIPVENLGPNTAGMATGFGNLFANLGGFSATYLLGYLKDSTGYFTSGFWVIAGSCAIGLLFTFTLSLMRKKSPTAKALNKPIS